MLPEIEKMFRVGSKAYVFCGIADIDEDGFSRVVSVEEYAEHGLRTTNGGDWCRSDGPLGKIFNIVRIKEKGKITSVQLRGFKKNTFERKVMKEMHDFYRKQPCAVLAISSGYIEVDHKDGRYDKYGRLSEDVNDYQPFHKCVNDAKRSHCKNCVETGL